MPGMCATSSQDLIARAGGTWAAAMETPTKEDLMLIQEADFDAADETSSEAPEPGTRHTRPPGRPPPAEQLPRRRSARPSRNRKYSHAYKRAPADQVRRGAGFAQQVIPRHSENTATAAHRPAGAGSHSVRRSNPAHCAALPPPRRSFWGSSTTAVPPPPLSRAIRPPCCSAARRRMEMPSPRPRAPLPPGDPRTGPGQAPGPAGRRENPAPLSLTVMRIHCFSRISSRSTTLPPSPAARMALDRS